MGGSGWRRVSATVDSGSADCLAPEDIARNIPRLRHHAKVRRTTPADGGVNKNKGEKTGRYSQKRVTSIVRGTRSPM